MVISGLPAVLVMVLRAVEGGRCIVGGKGNIVIVLVTRVVEAPGDEEFIEDEDKDECSESVTFFMLLGLLFLLFW